MFISLDEGGQGVGYGGREDIAMVEMSKNSYMDVKLTRPRTEAG